eukprot:1152317-Pelagomonas_calceolata.AAC.3
MKRATGVETRALCSNKIRVVHQMGLGRRSMTLGSGKQHVSIKDMCGNASSTINMHNGCTMDAQWMTGHKWCWAWASRSRAGVSKQD